MLHHERVKPFCELVIVYAEEAYGFARTGQTMLNVTDGKIIRMFVDDEPFFFRTAHLLRYDRRI